MKKSEDGLALAQELGRIARNPNEPFSVLVLEMESVESRFLEQWSDDPWVQLETRRRVAEHIFKLALLNSTAPEGECARRFARLSELGFSDRAQQSVYWTIYARYCLPRNEAIRLLRELVSLLEAESIQTNRDLASTRQLLAELSEAPAEPEPLEPPNPPLIQP